MVCRNHHQHMKYFILAVRLFTTLNILLVNMSSQRAQASLAKTVHCPHIAQVPDLESPHGDPDHPNL